MDSVRDSYFRHRDVLFSGEIRAFAASYYPSGSWASVGYAIIDPSKPGVPDDTYRLDARLAKVEDALVAQIMTGTLPKPEGLDVRATVRTLLMRIAPSLTTHRALAGLTITTIVLVFLTTGECLIECMWQ